MTDIIEQIDDLTTEQRCPHCGREWHQLALTRAVAEMFVSGYINSSYFTQEDTSPIVCDGSTFIGPQRPEPERPTFMPHWVTYDDVQWETLECHMLEFAPFSKVVKLLTAGFESLNINFNLWFGEPDPPQCDQIPDGLEIEFGPQNWLPATEPMPAAAASMKAAVLRRMPEFAAIETHAPNKRPYDFSQFDWEPPTYPTGKRKK